MRTDRYGWVLVFLIVLFVVQSFPPGEWQRPLSSFVAVAVILVTLRTSDFERPLQLVGVAVAVAVAIFAVTSVFTPGEVDRGVVDLSLALLFIATTGVIARRILGHRQVSTQTIFGAIDVYVLTGFAFAFLFAAVQRLLDTPFFADRPSGTSNEFVYFSFVTLSTLGFGDFTPAGDAGRSLAVTETITGQLLLVTILARVVSLLGERRAFASRQDS